MLIYNILFFLQILLATCSKIYLNHTKLIEPLDNKIRSLNYSEKTISGPVQSVRSLALLKNDLLVSGSYKNIQIWNITNGILTKTLHEPIGLVNSLIILNDGHLVGCSADLVELEREYTEDGWHGDVIIYDAKNLYKKNFVEVRFRIRSLAILNDNTFLSHYFDFYGFSYVSIYKTNGKLEKKFISSRTGNLIESIAVCVDKTIAVGTNNGEIQLWNGNYESWHWFYGGYIRSLKDHNGRIRSLAVLSDGFRLASGSMDRKIKIWNTKDGSLLRTIYENDYVYSLVILNDGSLASGCGDSKISIWNPNNGILLRVLEGHTKAVRSLVLLNDGRLASGSDDATIKIWKLESNIDIGTDTLLTSTNTE